MNLFEYKDLIDGKPMHIATVNKHNNPNLAVASDVKVIEENKIMISVNEMVNTQENIKYNHNVVLTVFDENYEGLRMFGIAEYYTEGKYFELDKEAFDEALFNERGIHIKGTIIVTVDKVHKYV